MNLHYTIFAFIVFTPSLMEKAKFMRTLSIKIGEGRSVEKLKTL